MLNSSFGSSRGYGSRARQSRWMVHPPTTRHVATVRPSGRTLVARTYEGARSDLADVDAGMLRVARNWAATLLVVALLASCATQQRDNHGSVQPNASVPVFSVVAEIPRISFVSAQYRAWIMERSESVGELLCASEFPDDRVQAWLDRPHEAEISINPIWSSQGADFVVMDALVDQRRVNVRLDFIEEDGRLCIASVTASPEEFVAIFSALG